MSTTASEQNHTLPEGVVSVEAWTAVEPFTRGPARLAHFQLLFDSTPLEWAAKQPPSFTKKDFTQELVQSRLSLESAGKMKEVQKSQEESKAEAKDGGTHAEFLATFRTDRVVTEMSQRLSQATTVARAFAQTDATQSSAKRMGHALKVICLPPGDTTYTEDDRETIDTMIDVIVAHWEAQTNSTGTASNASV